MGGMNGGLGASMANGSAASSMDALTQAYSGMQQYTASALPSLYGQSLLQQSIAGSQKEGEKFASLLKHTPASHPTSLILFLKSYFHLVSTLCFLLFRIISAETLLLTNLSS